MSAHEQFVADDELLQAEGQDLSKMIEGFKRNDIYSEAGTLTVRLARTKGEIKEAQRLRYQIFYEEMSAKPSWQQKLSRRDKDRFDKICDHMLVLDSSRPKGQQVVGNYRLLRQKVAQKHGGFYSEQEFNLEGLKASLEREESQQVGQLLELGRSCVHPDYRASATINLLWKGIARYLKQHNVGYMFGCASIEGTNAAEFKEALAYLYHNHRVPDTMHVTPHEKLRVEMNALAITEIDGRMARRSLPPLIKGYIRLGCYIGDGAVVDTQFGTTDVFILLPVEKITGRYLKHYDLKEKSAA